MEFLHTFLWLHFAGKPVVALQNVSCLLTQTDCLESTLHHVRNIGWVWDSLKIPTNYSPLLWLIISNDTVWFIKKETQAKPGFFKWGATEATHQIVMLTSMVYTAVLPCVSVGSVVLSRHECPSLRASSPIWASETSRARTRERAAKPRGAGERRACNHLFQIFICTSPRRREIPLAEKWRSGNQSWLITGQAGTRFVCVSNLVLRGIRLVPRTCFSPQCKRARLM